MNKTLRALTAVAYIVSGLGTGIGLRTLYNSFTKTPQELRPQELRLEGRLVESPNEFRLATGSRNENEVDLRVDLCMGQYPFPNRNLLDGVRHCTSEYPSVRFVRLGTGTTLPHLKEGDIVRFVLTDGFSQTGEISGTKTYKVGLAPASGRLESYRTQPKE